MKSLTGIILQILYTWTNDAQAINGVDIINIYINNQNFKQKRQKYLFVVVVVLVLLINLIWIFMNRSYKDVRARDSNTSNYQVNILPSTEFIIYTAICRWARRAPNFRTFFHVSTNSWLASNATLTRRQRYVEGGHRYSWGGANTTF